jgi:[acyl-carrier-protein] S-malonyltransferase
VEVASHTKQLAAASTAFRKSLSRVSIKPPSSARTRLLSGVDRSPVIDAKGGLDKLAAQISQTVQWSHCLQGCLEAVATPSWSLAPSEHSAGCWPSAMAMYLEDFRTLSGARSWLAPHANRQIVERPIVLQGGHGQHHGRISIASICGSCA